MKLFLSRISIGGTDLLQLPETGMRKIRGKRISMIFQEPMLSLNPVLTIAEQIEEVLQQHLNLSHEAMQARIRELLNKSVYLMRHAACTSIHFSFPAA